jgi:hypothetical protein
MNVAISLTLEGLVRALRWKAHELAENVEEGYAAGGGPVADRPAAGPERGTVRAEVLAGGTGDDLGNR